MSAFQERRQMQLFTFVQQFCNACISNYVQKTRILWFVSHPYEINLISIIGNSITKLFFLNEIWVLNVIKKSGIAVGKKSKTTLKESLDFMQFPSFFDHPIKKMQLPQTAKYYLL